MKNSLGLLASLTIIFTSHLCANDYQAESDFFDEAPVVLTVSRMNKPLAESPASVTVIDRQMIRDSGFREIADIFRLVPGFVVGYKYGGTPVVTYHGLGLEFHRQLQVLIDGRSVFIPSFGGVPWSNLPLMIDDIERIEVTRGPNAVTYGASAFLATINIITRHAAEDLGGKFIYTEELRLTNDLDDESTSQDFYLRYGDNYGDLDWRITAGRERDDGYSNQFDSKILEKFNIRTDFITAHNQFWTISAGINQSKVGRGDGKTTSPFRDENGSNSYQNIKWELQDENVQTTVKLTHTRQDIEDDFLVTVIDEDNALGFGNILIGSNEISFSNLSDRIDLEVFQNRFLTPELAWNYGASRRQDEVKSFWLFNNNQTQRVNTNNLFSSIEWKTPTDTIIDFGVLVEDSSITKQEESYRLSLIQSIDNHHVRVVSSTAKRNPIIWEQSGNISYDINVDPNFPIPSIAGQTFPFVVEWINDENVLPERIASNEIGLLSEFLDNQLTTDIKLFQYEISRHMTEEKIPLNLPPFNIDDDYKHIINGDSTDVEGIEFYFNYSPKPSNFRLYGGLSFVEATSFLDKFEESIPGRTGFLGGHYNFHPQHQVSAVIFWIDDMEWPDGDREKDSYEKFNLRYEYTLDRKNELKIELIGYNLADEYSDYFEENIQEESYLIRLSGKF